MIIEIYSNKTVVYYYSNYNVHIATYLQSSLTYICIYQCMHVWLHVLRLASYVTYHYVMVTINHVHAI